jgi:hypothetical protein
MVVHALAWVVAAVAVATLAAPLAGACSFAPFSRPDGQPLTREDQIRDSGPVVYGEVIATRVTHICLPGEREDTCGDLRSLVFRVDKTYKGRLNPIIEIDPLNVCDFEMNLGDRMAISPEPELDVFKAMGASAQYSVFGGVDVEQPEWDRYRSLWMGLEMRAREQPNDPERWREFARVMEQWRDYGLALEAYDRLAALLPQDLDIQASRGRMLFYLRMPEAKEVLLRVVAARPGDTRSKSLLAVLRHKPGEATSLTGLDLRDVDLRDMAFETVNFSRSDFRGADLRGTRLDSAKLDGADFRGAVLSYGFPDGYPAKGFEGASLRNADLTGNYIDGIFLAGADLQDAKLSGVDVRASYLTWGGPKSLIHANLSGARIKCDQAPDAARWQEADTEEHRKYWQDYIDELKLVRRVTQEQPAAKLDTSCADAIRDLLSENCAPWITKADRSPACKIGD